MNEQLNKLAKEIVIDSLNKDVIKDNLWTIYTLLKKFNEITIGKTLTDSDEITAIEEIMINKLGIPHSATSIYSFLLLYYGSMHREIKLVYIARILQAFHGKWIANNLFDHANSLFVRSLCDINIFDLSKIDNRAYRTIQELNVILTNTTIEEVKDLSYLEVKEIYYNQHLKMKEKLTKVGAN